MVLFLFLFTLLTRSLWAHPVPPPSHQFLKNAGIRYPMSRDTDLQSLILQIEKWSKRNSHPSIQIWSKYTRAQLFQRVNPSKSCQLFAELSNESRFPLADLSQWRARKVCSTPLEQWPKAPPSEWLINLSLNAQIASAQKTKDHNLYINSLVLKSQRSLPISQKVELIQTAIQYAKDHELEEKVKSLNQRLYQLAPRFIPRPQPSQYLTVATNFRRTRQFQKSLVYYKKIINGNFPHSTKNQSF